MQDFNTFYEPDSSHHQVEHEERPDSYHRPPGHLPQRGRHGGQRRFHQDQTGGFSDIFASDQRKTTAAPFKSGFK